MMPQKIFDAAEESDTRIGQRIREAREICGLSAPQLATLIGISRSGLYAMEAGEIGMKVDILERLARHLQTSMEWLRFGIGNGPRFARPVTVPEINVDHISFEMSTMMQYRTNNEWAIPLAEAQRLGLTESKLIGIRVNEAVPPEFRAGDVVALDIGANRYTRSGYYALIIDDRCTLCFVSKFKNEFEAKVRGQTIIIKEPKILGSVAYCFRGPSNFLLPLPQQTVR